MRYRRHARRAGHWAKGHSATLTRTATLFGLVSMQNYAKRVAVAPRPRARPRDRLRPWPRTRLGQEACVVPMRMSFRILGLISRRSAAYQMPGNLNVPMRGRKKKKGREGKGREAAKLESCRSKNHEPQAKFHLAFIHSCVAHSHSPR